MREEFTGCGGTKAVQGSELKPTDFELAIYGLEGVG
jgi:hypothetical protein